MNCRNERGFPKKLTSESFDKLKLTLKSFFAFCSVFFYKDQRRKDGNDFEKDTVPGFQNTPALHLRAKTYSALSFDQINFFNMANLFSLSRKPFVVCYCFREPIKTFFLDACQMIVKSCVLHLFPVLQTGRSHKALRAWAINRWKKTRSIIYSTDRKNEANKRYI